jgi:branched-chain amino acid transport system permease protein
MLENRLRRRNPLIQTIFDNWFYILILVFLWRFPHIVAAMTGSEANPAGRAVGESTFWQSVMIQAFILAILAISYNLMFGFTGLISFGHGVFYGTGVYTVAILVKNFEVSFARSIGVALLLSVIISVIWAVAAFRIKGVYFAMFTLAFAEIFFLLSKLTIFRSLTGGDDGISWPVPDWLNPIQNRLMVYNVTLTCLVVSFLLVRRLMNSPSGKVLVAIRDNQVRTQTLGFNIYLYKTLAIVVAGLLATLAGILHTVLERQAEPSVLGLGRTVDPLIMSLIGGIGTIPGPVVGAGLLRIGEEFLRKPDLQVDLNFIIYRYTDVVDSTRYWAVALGLSFILFVMVVPYGVVGQVNKIWIEMRRWLRRYVFNPIVRRYPFLATLASEVSGEPVEMGLALAQQPIKPSLREWVQQNPNAAINSLTMAVTLITGLVVWDWRVGVSWFLFLVVISLPLRIFIWLLHRPRGIFVIAILLAVVAGWLLGSQEDVKSSVMENWQAGVVVLVGLNVLFFVLVYIREPFVPEILDLLVFADTILIGAGLVVFVVDKLGLYDWPNRDRVAIGLGVVMGLVLIGVAVPLHRLLVRLRDQAWVREWVTNR